MRISLQNQGFPSFCTLPIQFFRAVDLKFACLLATGMLLLSCLIPFQGNSQAKARMKRFGASSKLHTIGIVFDVHSDQEGEIWVADSRYVFHTDGNKRKVPPKEKGLRTRGGVLRFCESPNGKLWALTYAGQLLHLEQDTFRLFNTDKLPKGNVYGFYVDKDETIHIGLNSGYYQLTQSNELTHVIGPESGLKGTIGLLLNDSIPFHFSLPTDESPSLTLLDSAFRVVQSIAVFESPTSADPQIHYRSFVRLQDGRLLFFLENMVLELLPNGKVKRHHFEYPVISIFQDKWEGIWVGTLKGGLLHFPKADLSNSAPAMYLEGRIAAVKAQDFEGGLWITSDWDGLYHIPFPKTLAYATLNPELEKFMDFTCFGDTVYFITTSAKFGTIAGGKITYYPWPVAKIEKSTQRIFPRIYFHELDSSIWISGAREYLVRKNGHWTTLHMPDTIVSNLRGTFVSSPIDSSLWTFTLGHLIQFKDRQFHNVIQLDQHNNWHKILFSPNNELIINAKDGSLRIFHEDRWSALSDTYPLQRSLVTNVATLGSYIATSADNQLFFSDKDSTYVLKSNNNRQLYSLSFNNSFDLKQSAANHNWMITNLGLSYFESREEEDFQIKQQHFDVFSDRNTTASYKFFSQKNGVIFGDFGKYIYTVDTTNLAKTRPKLSFEGLQINKQETDLQSKYELEYDQNNLQIYYTARTFMALKTGTRTTFFRYRLHGLDTTWTITEDRQVQYTTLPPGNYRFELQTKRMSDDGPSDSLFMEFIVHPPFWQTWWFRLLSILAGIGVVTGLVVWRFQAIRRKDALVYQKSRAEQKALQAQMNPHFIFNVMNSIQRMVIEHEEESAVESISWFSNLVRKNLDNSMLVELPLYKELETLELYLKLERQRMKQGFEYHIKVNESVDVELVSIGPMLLQPFVENAIWHGLSPKVENDRRLDISFDIEHDQLICTIRDNGIGRKLAAQRKDLENHESFGIRITQERLKIMGQQTGKHFGVMINDLNSNKGIPQGTEVILTLSF